MLPNSLSIFIQTPHTVHHLKDVATEMSIAQLKAKIELRAGIPKEHQILQLANKLLCDESGIKETNLRNSSVVKLLFSTTAAERLFTLANNSDFGGLVRAGIQEIELREGSTIEEQARLMAWNTNVFKRAFMAMFVASFNGNIQLLSQLIKFSALDINQVTASGRSSLHIAAARGSIGCVCLLLEQGINPRIADIDGKTAQDIAQEFGHIHCKRRIWLYNWNLKPSPTRNRPTGEVTKNQVKLPSLDVLKSASAISKNENTDEDLSKDRPLPQVMPKRVQQKTHRLQAPCTSHTCLESDKDVAVEEASTQDMGLVRELAAPTVSKQSIEEMNEELAVLANLARKYGYKIIQSANDLSDDASAHESSSYHEATREQHLDELSCHYEASSEQRTDLNENYSSLENREMCQDRYEMKENSHKQQIENKLPHMRKRLSMAAQSDHKSYLHKTESTELHERGNSLLAPIKHTRANDPKGAEYSIKLNVRNVQESKGIDLHSCAPNDEDTEVTVDLQEKGCTTTGDEAILNENESIETAGVHETDNSIKDGKEFHNRMGRVALMIDNKEDLWRVHSAFDEWVRRKAQQNKELKKQNSISTNLKEKRQELSDRAFKRWLQSKQVRQRSASVSPRSSDKGARSEHQRPVSGLSFESWVKKKGEMEPRSFSLAEEKPSHAPIKRVYSSGITYSEWIESKKRELAQSSAGRVDATEETKSRTRIIGMSFEQWANSKATQSQIDRVQKANDQMRAEYGKEVEKETRWKNCRVKTYEEWQLGKKFEDRIRKAKEKAEKRRESKSKIKFEEDSKLVYNMWLLNKHLNELQQEEEKLTTFRKERERERNIEGKSLRKKKTQSL